MGHTYDKLRACDVALCAINFRRLIDELWALDEISSTAY